MNVSTASAASPGRMTGTMIRVKMPSSEQPSIRAASKHVLASIGEFRSRH
jgi:hypothetical protein